MRFPNPTVTISVEMPMHVYLIVKQLANELGVDVGHAAALTIMSGQQLQSAMLTSDETPEYLTGKESEDAV